MIKKKNDIIILKDTYEGNASEITYTKPLFDRDGNWVINMEISKEEYEKNI
jgi:hypothetical protein